MSHEPVLLGAVRAPIGAFLGGLKDFTAPQLGAHVLKALLERVPLDPARVDEVIMGHVLTAGVGQAPARQAALGAGLPPSVAAFTVNKVCGSGLKAVMLAAQAVSTGDADFILAGGQESMSQAPYLAKGLRAGQRLGHAQLIDSLIADGLWCAREDFHMGSSAELVAREYKVSREEQDRYALESHRRAVAAAKAGHFKAEMAPVSIPQRKGDALLLDRDEGPREDSSLEKLASLKPAFEKDGTVTAGNASTINDGAAAVAVACRKAAEKAGLRPLARVAAYATAGVEPKWVMMAPVEAVKKVWAKTGWKRDDVDLYELNEAFSAQSVALLRALELDPAKVNVRGGAVALGHPIGASGARVLVTLLHALRDSGKKKGIASLCLGGGNAVAMAVEMA